jgi:hypothetical protein
MTTARFLARLDILEQRVNVLETLPARVDALADQILQLRHEVRDAFSALRGEMRTGDGEAMQSLREEIRAGDEETRRQLREEIRAGDKETRWLMRELIAETRTHMLVLHEDLVERIKRIGEGPRAAMPAGSEGDDTTPRPPRKPPRRMR